MKDAVAERIPVTDSDSKLPADVSVYRSRLVAAWTLSPILAKESVMLILSRKEQETLVIGDDVFLTIVEIRAGQVRIAIDAPRSVAVNRKEIWLKIKKRELAGGRQPATD